jgi:hypothetical protein
MMMRALAPEHLDDIRKSGLTDDTITRCQYVSVRPHDIKIPGVESAYELPYFKLDATTNCFARWRLFPPLKTDHGTRKYHQPAGSDPHLYLPPLLGWQVIAADAIQPIVIVEGEKKSASMCQAGLAGMGLSGTWGWTAKWDDVHRVLLPLLDQFVWNGRPVEIVPDSDGWRPEKLRDVLGGFYALGMELIHRGATVQFVRLIDRHGVKVGPDDFLVHEGAEWSHTWPHLERVLPDDVRLKPVQAWWQQWRARQATAEALRSPELEAVDVTETGSLYTVSFPSYRIRLYFDRLSDASNRVNAELTVMLGDTELLGETSISLKSDPSREKIARTLKGLTASYPWKRLLERACTATCKRYQVGEPIIALEPSESVHVPFLLNPFIHQQHPSLIYAPGGSLKSYLGLYFALLASHGVPQNGLAALQVPVIYLDWELNRETVGGRLKALQAGHPELAQCVPFYRRCERPLHQEVAPIARHVAEHGVQLLILDSAAMACGGELNKPETVIQLTRALRTIGCASLLLAHVPKITPEGQERSAFGSIYFRELARNVWELERADGDDPVRVILTHTKHNFTSQHAPIAFEFTFQPEAVCITACNPNEEPAFEEKLGLSARVRNLLDDDKLRTTEEIAEALGIRTPQKLRSLRSTLSQGKKARKWSLVTTPDGDRWTVLKGHRTG